MKSPRKRQGGEEYPSVSIREATCKPRKGLRSDPSNKKATMVSVSAGSSSDTLSKDSRSCRSQGMLVFKAALAETSARFERNESLLANCALRSIYRTAYMSNGPRRPMVLGDTPYLRRKIVEKYAGVRPML